MPELSNSDLCWDEFWDWAEDNGVYKDSHPDDWEPWWDCWGTAIRSKLAHENRSNDAYGEEADREETRSQEA